jgi:Xaa-Pro aminopeptidase
MLRSLMMYAPGELDRFREVQRLAYRCAETVGAGLEPGVTEREAAGRVRRFLLEHGVDDWFHLPFAWFGDRTAFVGFRLPHQFFPTSRRLEEGMPYILDVAPISGGYTADIGYAGCLGENAVHAKLMADLAEYRELVLEGVRAGRSLRTVYDDVDRLIERHGYTNRHRAYPFGVIAHRVGVVRGRGPRPTVAGFGVRALRSLAHDGVMGRRGGWSPLWGPGRASDHPPTPGMWAVEPHIGFRGVGVKFEELLVVTEGDAFWLDDDLPHVRRWRAGAAAVPA